MGEPFVEFIIGIWGSPGIFMAVRSTITPVDGLAGNQVARRAGAAPGAGETITRTRRIADAGRPPSSGIAGVLPLCGEREDIQRVGSVASNRNREVLTPLHRVRNRKSLNRAG